MKSAKKVKDPALYFITGGCKSGKSHFAQKVAESIARRRIFVATATASDSAMQKRIAQHQAQRDSSWQTLEIIPGSFFRCFKNNIISKSYFKEELPKKEHVRGEVILFDCLTLWIAGEQQSGLSESMVPCFMDALFLYLFSFQLPVVMVSNEVGFGGIAGTPMGRQFCDMAGTANQLAAKRAKAVGVSISGIAVSIKGEFPTNCID